MISKESWKEICFERRPLSKFVLCDLVITWVFQHISHARFYKCWPVMNICYFWFHLIDFIWTFTWFEHDFIEIFLIMEIAQISIYENFIYFVKSWFHCKMNFCVCVSLYVLISPFIYKWWRQTGMFFNGVDLYEVILYLKTLELKRIKRLFFSVT